MSVRANHVIRVAGESSIFFEKNGAETLHMRFFWGNVHDAVAHIRQHTEPKHALMDDVWCEGASLIDLDAKRILFFGGGEPLSYYPWRRRVLLPVMRALLGAANPDEPKWTIDWAHEEISSIADAAGIPRARVVAERVPSACPTDFNYERTLEELAAAPQPSSSMTVLTVRGHGGRVRDVGIPRARPTSDVGEIFRHGEAILPVLLAREPLTALPSESRVTGGALVDVEARTISAWSARPSASLRSRLEQRWPAWSIDVHGGGFPEHVRASGRDADAVCVPLDAAVEEALHAAFEGLYGHDPEPAAQQIVRLGERLVDAGWGDEEPFASDETYGGSTRTAAEWRADAIRLARRVVVGDGPRWSLDAKKRDAER